MKQALGTKVSLMSLLLSIEGAKVIRDAVQTYVCAVFALFEACAKTLAALVLKVDLLGNIAEVGKPVVQFVPVKVVDVVRGDDARHIKPRKSVGKMQSVIDAHCEVSIPCLGPYDAGDGLVLTGSDLPLKHPGNRVVVKNLFESFVGETRIAFAHAAAPVKHWFGKLPPGLAGPGGRAILHQGV